MPNTLCHIAVQGPASRLLYRKAGFLWIVTGCIIPDVPWIIFRIVRALGVVDMYDLKLYSTVQASFMFCLIASLFLALLAEKRWSVFFLLASNSLVHLLFDATQIKWGNGVHLLAPFNWQMFHLEWLWPEHSLFIYLSGIGVVYFLWRWKVETCCCPIDVTRGKARMVLAVSMLLLYLLGPFIFMGQAERANAHCIDTLRQVQNRSGKTLLVDRDHYDHIKREITLGTGDQLKVRGVLPDHSAMISIKGYFASPDLLISEEYREHRLFRYWASISGLFLACVLWAQSLLVCWRRKRQSKNYRKEQ